jgi:hypothetical protein
VTQPGRSRLHVHARAQPEDGSGVPRGVKGDAEPMPPAEGSEGLAEAYERLRERPRFGRLVEEYYATA